MVINDPIFHTLVLNLKKLIKLMISQKEYNYTLQISKRYTIFKMEI